MDFISTVLEHLAERLPAVLVGMAVYAAGRWLYLHFRSPKTAGKTGIAGSSVPREAALALFALYAATVLSLTFIPFRFTFPPEAIVLKSNFLGLFLGTYTTGSWGMTMFLSNVLMFMPLGLLMPVLWRQTPAQTLGLSLAVILAIELLQPFAGRGFDVDYILLNFAGTALGTALAALLLRFSGDWAECIRAVPVGADTGDAS